MIGRTTIVTTLLLLLASCGPQPESETTVVFAQDSREPENGLLTETVSLATEMGLVTFDAGALVRPGIAERWVISDDGMSYIFRIGDYRWADGETVTAQQIAEMLRQRLRALRGDPLATEVEAIDDVIARTDQIIEIQLNSPRPRMLDLLAGPQLTLARNNVGLGPMKALATSEDSMRLYWPSDAAAPSEAEDYIYLLNATPAKAIALYQSGATDIVLGLDYTSVPLVNAAEVPADALIKDSAMGHFGLDILRNEGVLARPVLREAIAMGIDRPRLLAAFGVADWNEMTTLSPTQMTNRIDIEPALWARLETSERKARALQRIAEAGFRGSELALFIPKDGPGSDLLFGLLRRELAEIGLNLTRSENRSAADLLLVDQVADFDDPLWYLTRLGCARQRVCDEQSDEMVEEARGLRDIPGRILLLAQAEARLTANYSYIPLAEPLRLFLRRRPMVGLEANFRALHPLQYIGGQPDQ